MTSSVEKSHSNNFITIVQRTYYHSQCDSHFVFFQSHTLLALCSGDKNISYVNYTKSSKPSYHKHAEKREMVAVACDKIAVIPSVRTTLCVSYPVTSHCSHTAVSGIVLLG